LIAVITYFRSDVLQLITGAIGSLAGKREFENKLPWLVVLGTFPAIGAGLVLEHWAETTFRSPLLMASTLAGIGLLMGWADHRSNQGGGLESLTAKKVLLIGLAQCLALVPGVSRSGITIITGLLLGLDRSAAVRFSFLLSIPIIAGAGILKIDDVFAHTGEPTFWLGLAVSAVSGFAAIHFLITYVRANRFTPFVIYRLALAAVVVAVAFGR
jgi:undecaprenyl-diphosphatase